MNVCGGKACINALVPSNNLQYVDNTVLLAHTEEDLQALLTMNSILVVDILEWRLTARKQR